MTVTKVLHRHGYCIVDHRTLLEASWCIRNITAVLQMHRVVSCRNGIKICSWNSFFKIRYHVTLRSMGYHEKLGCDSELSPVLEMVSKGVDVKELLEVSPNFTNVLKFSENCYWVKTFLTLYKHENLWNS
jgi:hypothetical protein